MRQLKLSIVTSKKIDVIGKSALRKIEKSDDLATVLSDLFPEKIGYWNKGTWKQINISFVPVIPFGPEPEILKSFLFSSLEEDLSLLVKQYGLKKISLIGLEHSRGKKESSNALSLSPLELKNLIDVTKGKETADNVLISVFINPEEVFSFSVSRETDFASFFSSAFDNYSIDDFIDTVNGRVLTGKTLIASSQIRYISYKGWFSQSRSNFIFSYPDFNRTIHMAHIEEKKEEPCINCLACASTCPADLYPALLYHHIKDENFTEATSMGLNYCLFCHRCSVVCPSNIPLSEGIINNISSLNGADL